MDRKCGLRKYNYYVISFIRKIYNSFIIMYKRNVAIAELPTPLPTAYVEVRSIWKFQ
jgi:hypothetical protein